jgi:hypothetical protein
MNFTHFNQLHAVGGAIVDLGSALEIFDADSCEFVSGDGSFGELRQYVNELPTNDRRSYIVSSWSRVLRLAQPHEAALGMLEQAVVHDRLIIDRILVDPLIRIRGLPQSPDTLAAYDRIFSHEFFALTDVPESVRQAAAEAIYKNRRIFAELTYRPEEPFYGPDKTLHDALRSVSDVYSRHCFATSEDCAERAWFYLSVSNAAQMPLIVSSAKRHYLTFLGAKLRATMHAALTKRLLHDDIAAATEALADEVAPSDAPLLPVQEMILVKSLRENLSPLDACLALRNSVEAKEYRAKLRRIYLDLRGPADCRQKAQKAITDLTALVAKWRTDPDEEIKYRSYTLQLGKLPMIDWIADGFDPPIEWRLPKWLGTILNSPNPSHVFISSWFRGVDSAI